MSRDLESDPEPGMPPVPVLKPQPGLIPGVVSIFAGAVAFGIPVLGIVAACIGIGLGIAAIRRGRAGSYKPSITCGIIGIALSVLSVVYWVCVVLFSSYR